MARRSRAFDSARKRAQNVRKRDDGVSPYAGILDGNQCKKRAKKNKKMTGSETCMCRTSVVATLSPYVLQSQKRGEIGMGSVRKFSKRVRHGRLRKIEKAIEIERKQSSRVTFEAELVTRRGELTMQKRRFARGSPRLSIASFKSFAGVITTMISVPRARIFIRLMKTRSTRSQLRYYLRAI